MKCLYEIFTVLSFSFLALLSPNDHDNDILRKVKLINESGKEKLYLVEYRLTKPQRPISQFKSSFLMDSKKVLVSSC